MSAAERQFDVVMWGATGIAGRFASEYLTARYAPSDLSLALGGRDRERLESLAEDLAAGTDAWEEVPVVIADATDPESLRAMARETEVVCTTVGPYTTYGTPLVAACIECGTDYCDLTGEVNWMRETVDAYHDAAVDAGVRIVHSCGFDSVPADIGTLLVQSSARETHGATCDTVRIYVEAAKGGVSGGTLASIAEVFEAAEDASVRKVLGNPYSLAPPGEREGPDPGEQRRPRSDPLRPLWTGPSPMAPVNERVVRRSNALLDYPWGRDFRCTEVIPTGSGLRGAAGATLLAGGLGLFTAAMSVGPLRSGIRRYLFPDPGDGPTSAETAEGHFEVRVIGTGTGANGSFSVEAEFGADWGPGYGATGRMLGESAMCLLKDDTASPLQGGVLTPASAIGLPLADRLRAAGFTADVVEANAESSR